MHGSLRLITTACLLLTVTWSATPSPHPDPHSDVCPESHTCSPQDWGRMYPYYPECSKYIYCGENGENVLSDCPTGLHFSPALEDCTDQEVADCLVCGARGWQQRGDALCPPEEPCTEQNLYHLLPYPPDCSRYIYCAGVDEPKLRRCPVGYLFSPTDRECTTPELAQCPECWEVDTTTTTEELTTSTSPGPLTTLPTCPKTPTCTAAEFGQLKPYPPDCTKYLFCNALGNAEPRTCLPAGQHFSPTEKICTSPEIANCPLCLPAFVFY